MHAVYANARREIFTRVTLNELVERGLDIHTPAGCVLVKATGGHDNGVGDTLQKAVGSVRRQFRATKGPIILDLDQCRVLRRLEDIIFLDMKGSK